MVWLRAVGRRPWENTRKSDDYEKPFKILSSVFSNFDLFDADLQPTAYSLQSEASHRDAETVGIWAVGCRSEIIIHIGKKPELKFMGT